MLLSTGAPPPPATRSVRPQQPSPRITSTKSQPRATILADVTTHRTATSTSSHRRGLASPTANRCRLSGDYWRETGPSGVGSQNTGAPDGVPKSTRRRCHNVPGVAGDSRNRVGKSLGRTWRQPTTASDLVSLPGSNGGSTVRDDVSRSAVDMFSRGGER